MDREVLHAKLMTLEIETTKMRYATFTALLSVSFILPGFAAHATQDIPSAIPMPVSVRSLVFLLGFLFYIFAVFHYWWYHRYAHRYRKELKKIEEELGISIYRLRRRPLSGRFKLHFDRALYVIGTIYGFVVLLITGWPVFAMFFGATVILYLVLLALTYWSPEEPFEE